MSQDFQDGRDDFRDEIVEYLKSLDGKIPADTDLTEFIRVLAKRIDNFEVP